MTFVASEMKRISAIQRDPSISVERYKNMLTFDVNKILLYKFLIFFNIKYFLWIKFIISVLY